MSSAHHHNECVIFSLEFFDSYKAFGRVFIPLSFTDLIKLEISSLLN